VGHTAHGEMRNTYRIFVLGNVEGRHHLGDLGIGGRIILKFIVKK
jgi:hypothetical protein